jgi:hypothetical protein
MIPVERRGISFVKIHCMCNKTSRSTKLANRQRTHLENMLTCVRVAFHSCSNIHTHWDILSNVSGFDGPLHLVYVHTRAKLCNNINDPGA